MRIEIVRTRSPWTMNSCLPPENSRWNPNRPERGDQLTTFDPGPAPASAGPADSDRGTVKRWNCQSLGISTPSPTTSAVIAARLEAEDKDFGMLAYAGGHQAPGIVLIRFPNDARRGLGEAMSSVVA
jgi:hypothetical protein